jgi:hypothetical protein
MNVRRGGYLFGIAAAALVAGGCRAKETAASQERLNVLSNPSMYLDTSGLTFDDDASYHEQLLEMTVFNKSGVTVSGLEGDVVWLDDNGQRIGSSHFALKGTVPAHGSQRFSIAEGTMTSGPLRGGALRVVIAFSHVNVAG